MNIEWDIPFKLTSPYGELPFNSEPDPYSGVYFVLDPTGCSTSAPIRLTRDELSQADGAQLHREFTGGYEMRLKAWLMESKDQPACGAMRRRAWEALQLHLHALLGNDVTLDGDNARITWEPTEYGDSRLLGDVRLLEEAKPTQDGSLTTVEFAIHSRYPYAVDGTQITQTLPVVATNGGNTPYFPQFKAFDVSILTITNETTGLSIVYDATQPGGIEVTGGDYAFFDSFRQSVYLNGDETNLEAAIVPTDTDYFALVPGDNVLSTAGSGAVSVIYNAAWY